MARVPVLAILILFGASLYPIGQAAAPAPTAEDKPIFVVALFRHGIRTPTPQFNQCEADKHSGRQWPDLSDWKPMPSGSPADCDSGNGWGYLTIHGQEVAQRLGAYYGKIYGKIAEPNGLNVYLWADGGNQRTRETAKALRTGLTSGSGNQNTVTVDFLPNCAVDPLFHPFKGQCGTPNAYELQSFASGINQDSLMWADTTYQSDFSQLYDILKCSDTGQCSMPLKWVNANATTCLVASSDCSSPLQWKGRYSYASSATEGFLLEWANAMPEEKVGWGRVNPEKNATMQKMLGLHEFYFAKTDRFLGDNKQPNPDLVSVEGSNLIREILDQLNRKANPSKVIGKCLRGTTQNNFVGLVGHDTNLAAVGALLGLNWQFDDEKLPGDTKGLPANDALPAGALVFELHQRSGASFVRVKYVTQSLEQMRKGKDGAFELPVAGPPCGQTRACEIPLENFQKLVEEKIGRQFLSTCTAAGEQTCGLALGPGCIQVP